MLRFSAIALASWFAIALTALAKPNVIVFFTDDHGYADLGCQGILDDVKTPHIDALAKAGVRATNGYVTAPQCVPSRAGLLIGKFQSRFGVERNGASLDGFNAELTIAERLKEAGYATGQIGKWHLGPSPQIPSHGFDDVYAKNNAAPAFANFTLEGKTREMGREPSDLYHVDACSQAATAFIERHKEKPFFLYVAYRAPHVPLDAPKKYLDRFPGEMPERRRQALAMLSAVDDGVGLVMKALRQHQLEENTLIFFIGDNGAPLKITKEDAPGGGPGWDGSLNDPLLGEKGMLTEGGMRVPFVVSWKGKIPGDQVYDAPLSSLDVAATALAQAGFEAEGLDGVNLIPYLTGEAKGEPHEQLAWRWVAQSAIRVGNYKLFRAEEQEWLFDVVADPEEQKDLLASRPEVADQLREKLKSWAAELDPPGLAYGNLSHSSQNYMRFYLEGKEPLPKPNTRDFGPSQGWNVRNAIMTPRENDFLVKPLGEKAGFMSKSGTRIESPSMIKVKVRSEAGGNLGIGWRLANQDSFPDEQKATKKIRAGGDFETHRFQLDSEGDVIHLRLLLPPGECQLQSVIAWDLDGNDVELLVPGKP